MPEAARRSQSTSARELAEFLADSDEAQSAFVEQMFHSLVQQPVQAYGPHALDELRHSFAESGFNIRKLAVAIMTISAGKPSETENWQHDKMTALQTLQVAIP